MSKISKRNAVSLLLATLATLPAWAVTEVKSIEFKVKGGKTVVELQATGPLTYTEEKNSGDRQLIMNLSDVKLSKSAARKLDTSSFNSPISLVSPYMVSGKKGEARVVVQFRDWRDAVIESDGNKVRIITDALVTGQAADAPTADAPPPIEGVDPEATANRGSLPPETAAENLKTFEQGRSARQFTGAPITLQVREADIRDVMRVIGETSGFNVVLSEKVTGTITLSLIDIPWDQALDVVLQTKRLGAERSGSILRVLPIEDLTKEKQDDFQAKQAADKIAPKVTRVFSVSYASLDDLAKILKDFGNAQTQQVAGAPIAQGQSAGSVSIDKRTNSLIVQDTQENIERMAKLIELLDTQTPQVLVEAKVVESSDGFSKSISGGFSLSGSNSASSFGPFFGSFNGQDALNDVLSTGGTTRTDLASGTQSGSVGFSPRISGVIPTIDRMNLLLTIGESDNEVKVVTSPRVVVLNNQTAKISQGVPTVITQVVINNGVQTNVPTVTQGQIFLEVTPTVTNDEGVLLKLKLSRDVSFDLGGGQSTVAARALETSLLVDSGSTIVLGGLYTTTTRKSSGGFPFLRDIPLLGPFFGAKGESNERSELFFFVTPRVLNSKRAGLSPPGPG